jgi:hypothetical protein
MIRIVFCDLIDQLQPHRCFSRTLGTKYNRCSWLLGISHHLAPRGVKSPSDAKVAKDRIGLRVLIDKRIADKLVVL